MYVCMYVCMCNVSMMYLHVLLEQRQWRSCLTASVVKEMPEYKALVKEAEAYVCI